MIRELFLGEFPLSNCVWQSTIFLVVGLVSSFILRHRSSRAHQLLFLAMMAAVIVPIMSILVKHYELGMFIAEPVAIQLPAEDLTGGSNYGAPGITSAENIEHKPGPIEKDLPPAIAGSESAKLPWRSVVLYGWIAASLILFSRLLVTFLLGVRILGRALPIESEKIEQALHLARAKLGIDKDVKVRSSRGVRSPVIWCWRRRPVLLVPSAAGRFDNGIDWAGVLCHELAHWKRRDHISGLLAELAVCILPWHPLLWWAKSRLVRLSEQACDDWVVATGQPGIDYAESLLDLTPGGQMAFVPAVVSSKKGLAGRVRRILKDSCGNPRTGALWALTVSIVAACLAIGVACAQTRPAKPEAATEYQTKAANLLHQAAADDDIEQVKSLIAKGADVNAKDKNGQTPLHIVCSRGNKDMAKLLIAKGVDINAKSNTWYTTPLIAAIRNGHEDIANLLIVEGADVNARGRGDYTALHWAAMNRARMTGSTDIMKLLLASGADIEAKQEHGATPLACAAFDGNTESANFLIEHGADIEAKLDDGETTPLFRAVRQQYVETAKLLLAKGADIHARWRRLTVIHVSMMGNSLSNRKSDKEIVKLLIEKGLKSPPIHLAAYFGDLQKMKDYLTDGTRINEKDAAAYTPLHCSVCGDHMDAVKFLLSKGADVNAKTTNGWTPLGFTWTVDMAAFLIANGADVRIGDENGQTALHWAVNRNNHRGDKALIKLLLKHGADINAKAASTSVGWPGWTPFHVACRNGNKTIVEMLIAKGADINAKTDKDYTPLSLAKQKNHKQVVELLRKHGAKE